MNQQTLWKTMAVVTMFQSWLQKASADGRISLAELTELAEAIADILGLPVEWDIPMGHSDEMIGEAVKSKPE